MKTSAVVCLYLSVLAGPALEAITAAQAERAMRTWTDNTGQFSVVAEFVELKDGRVVLKKDSGSITSVPLERLSAEDRGVRRKRAGFR